MEPRRHCAYNQTRGCFLGLDVVAGDFSCASLDDWMPVLTPNSGAGLWMVPFRGIPATSVRVPLDLVYLDEDCRVIDEVEFFPSFRVSPSSPPAASVLVLPTHSIYSSQTHPGDQLMLCAVEEMTWRLEQFSSASGIAGAVPRAAQNPVLVRQEPSWSPGPGLLQSGGSGLLQAEDTSTEQRPESHETHEMVLVEPKKNYRPPESWLERWLLPDPRKSPRVPAPALAVYFWTGGVPQAHGIRDISATGLYVVTEERWYPGTVVRMTITTTNSVVEQPAGLSITVQARAVRWGDDGVGLEFVLRNAQKPRREPPLLFDGADSKQFNQFLGRFRVAAAREPNHATCYSASGCSAYTAGGRGVMPQTQAGCPTLGPAIKARRILRLFLAKGGLPRRTWDRISQQPSGNRLESISKSAPVARILG